MPVKITIRDVPEDVHKELAARAARCGQSMQEFLLGELKRFASRPSNSAWLQDARRRKEALGTRLTAEEILEARDADRR